MTWPPPYPRIPHLFPSPATTRDDLVVPDAERTGWLTSEVLVEEKLDGANVALWADGGDPHVATRGGVGARDRAGQLGRLRAWVAERGDALSILLGGNVVAYAEWLWVTHSLAYDRLPDFLVLLDVMDSTGRFAPVEERDERARAAGLVVPPRLVGGVLRDRPNLGRCLARSAWGPDLAEGVVLRRGSERCKVVRPDFRPKSDEAWLRDGRRNMLATDRVRPG